MSYRSRIQEGVSRQIGPFSCGQKGDVVQAAEGLKSSDSDDGGLNLTVDVFSDGVAGPQAVGREDSWKVSFQRITQALEGFKATPSLPRSSMIEIKAQGLRRLDTTGGFLEALVHAPGSGGPEA